jgi:hypothetical protein
LLCLAALYDTSAQYHEFKIPQTGRDYVDEIELAFYVWYGLWGSLAAAAFMLMFVQAGLAQALATRVERMLERRASLAVAFAACAVCVAALWFRGAVLLDQPVADDESTYLFEAQTLLQGRVINPLPPAHPMFQNQFVILNSRGWYGKYPIGHPLLLAIGEGTGVRSAVVPVLGALCVWLAFALGSRLFGRRRAALGACLLLLSPQFVWTLGTQLSQPSSALCMLLGAWAMVRLDADARLRWALLAGAAFGFGLLVRPMPTALFLGVALLHHLVKTKALDLPRPWRTRLLQLVVLAGCASLFALALLAVNRMQAGSPLSSGYETVHSSYGLFENEHGEMANSLGAALVRQNFWLFGWTLSLLFVPFARPSSPILFWGLLAAEYAYRLAVPKTVVSTTGPIYMFEIVPLLALASADGAVRAAEVLRRLGSERPRVWVLAFALASSLVALTGFVPVQLRPASRSSALRARVYQELAHRRAAYALVFADQLVNSQRGETWAYFPPNPSPSFDDEVLFVRKPKGPGSARGAYAFWRKLFPQRRAFVYADTLERGALLGELDPRPPSAEAALEDSLPPAAASGPSRGEATPGASAEPQLKPSL